MPNEQGVTDLPVVAILGDSRAFDTYYVNPAYGASGYGYQHTFPALLRRMLLRRPEPFADAIHIPDHFRGATIENNIIRLALTEPSLVVLLDGIWESLLTKEQFLEYVAAKIRSHPWKEGAPLNLSFSSRRLAELFIAGELPVSPAGYARRQRKLISYFRRRRRQCLWLTLPIPPRHHLGGLHYAGNYLTIPEWGECLAAINAALVPMVEGYGARVLDLDALMRDHGGAAECLLDQWHFTPRFHATIAARLANIIDESRAELALPSDHLSRRFMLSRRPEGDRFGLYGELPACEAWIAAHPDVAAEVCAAGGQSPLPDHPVVLLLDGDEERREAEAIRLLEALRPDQIIVYAEELCPLVNPAGNERVAHGQLR